MVVAQARWWWPKLDGGGQGLVDGRLEAAHMLHWQAVRVTRLQVLVQCGKYLVVEDLELPDPVNHLLQLLKHNGPTLTPTFTNTTVNS